MSDQTRFWNFLTFLSYFCKTFNSECEGSVVKRFKADLERWRELRDLLFIWVLSQFRASKVCFDVVFVPFDCLPVRVGCKNGKISLICNQWSAFIIATHKQAPRKEKWTLEGVLCCPQCFYKSNDSETLSVTKFL